MCSNGMVECSANNFSLANFTRVEAVPPFTLKLYDRQMRPTNRELYEVALLNEMSYGNVQCSSS